MHQSFLFLFFLLTATISVIDAVPHRLRRGTTVFTQCPYENPPPVLEVAITPDPIAPGRPFYFAVNGTTVADIDASDDVQIGVLFGTDPKARPLTTPFTTAFCNVDGNIACPLKAGTSYSRTGLSVPTPQTLPPSFQLFVTIVNVRTKFVHGCALANVETQLLADGVLIERF
ncbi:9667_t:CDS:1 [Paraglomus occultum]|uniref:Phosphatidylglycerol/phosphatidylinositol transfer protein n=1 Tax=Paraglomus occultum TaxID=144539 RepID=A0A9N8ZTB9_9GLOM|nr:9667_t:CDS:1 [Paraglomus occultum]